MNLGFQTYLDAASNNATMQQMVKVSSLIDQAVTIFFITEAAFKIIALGFFLDKGSYLRDSWNILDFIIVASSIIEYSLVSFNLSQVKLFKLLRALRPLRFLNKYKSTRIIVSALVESIGGLTNVLVIILLVWSMFGILGVYLLQNRLWYCDMDLLS